MAGRETRGLGHGRPVWVVSRADNSGWVDRCDGCLAGRRYVRTSDSRVCSKRFPRASSRKRRRCLAETPSPPRLFRPSAGCYRAAAALHRQTCILRLTGEKLVHESALPSSTRERSPGDRASCGRHRSARRARGVEASSACHAGAEVLHGGGHASAVEALSKEARHG